MTKTHKEDHLPSWEVARDGELALAMRPEAADEDYNAAWEEFTRRHVGHVMRFIEQRARDLGADVCEDLMSETELRIMNGVTRFEDRGPGSLRSWSFAVAENVIRDFRRGRLRAVSPHLAGAAELVSFEEVEERYSQGLAAGSNDDHDAITTPYPEKEPRPSARAVALGEAFDSLTATDQAIVWLRVVHEESDAEIAAITRTPRDHVRKMLYKAVKKLKKRFTRALA